MVGRDGRVATIRRAELLSDLESLEEVPAWLRQQPANLTPKPGPAPRGARRGIPAMARATAQGPCRFVAGPHAAAYASILFARARPVGALLFLCDVGGSSRGAGRGCWRRCGLAVAASLGYERDSLRDGSYAVSRSSRAWASRPGLAWGLGLRCLRCSCR